MVGKIGDAAGAGRARAAGQPLVHQPRRRISRIIGVDQTQTGLLGPALGPVAAGIVVGGHHAAGARNASGHALEALRVEVAQARLAEYAVASHGPVVNPVTGAVASTVPGSSAVETDGLAVVHQPDPVPAPGRFSWAPG